MSKFRKRGGKGGRMSEGGEFRLEVPLDASQIPDFKPDRPVKVVVYNKEGNAQERLVKLNASGKGTASFGFREAPGSLQVMLGPETASVSDLQHLQTISVNVPASSFRAAREVSLPAVAISSYYWWWWWWWCQNFKITGRVLCADGSPVIGATVCAFDVDWWWWWTSQENVGCATTDATGSFEIDFTRCCGWWPWWWWLTREWQVDPILVDKITAHLQQDPKFGRLPAATPVPSLDVFRPLLATAGKTARAPIAASPARSRQAIAQPAVDPAALAGLRERLVEVLPSEFPIPIWPWFPWFPWWDCGANIIFKVTQVCGGQTNIIVNETVSDTRWNIPNTLNVTLTANDSACCAFNCDGQDCPTGNCIVPTDICDINVGFIGGNIGAPPCTPAQVGLFSPGVQDRPFAGAVDIFGRFGDSVDVDYYEFQYATSEAGPYTPLPLAAVGGFSRQVLHILPGPTFAWVPVNFPVSTISDGTTDHNVIETIAHYEANHGIQTWDSITHDLLMVLNSLNTLANGTYYLRMVSYVRPGYSGDLALASTDDPDNPGVLTVCDPNPDDPLQDNYWALTLDNRAPGNTDPSGQPCGLHLCTDQPTSAILQIAIVRSGTTTVIQACDNICIEPSDLLQIDFVAYDPDGFLDSYGMELLYGVDQSVDLLCSAPFPACSPAFSTWSLAPSPIAPPWAPAAAQVGPNYSSALAQLATSPVWSGGSMRLTVNASSAFPQTCAYLLQLNVSKRPIQNCDAINDEQNNVSFESFTIKVGC